MKDSKTDCNDLKILIDSETGFKRSLLFSFNLENDFSAWKLWRTNDGRILPNAKSSFSLMTNPFDSGNLVQLKTYFDPVDAGKSFGGFGIRAPVRPPVAVTSNTFLEFELYYPETAAGKYMRFELWSTSSGGEGVQGASDNSGTKRSQVYIRTSDLESVEYIRNDRIGFYSDETWYKRPFFIPLPVSTGEWDYLNIDIHTEIGSKLTGDILMIGNIIFTQKITNENTIPDVVNKESYKDVEPIKKKYNPQNGYFLVGSADTGVIEPDSLRARHYQIFVDKYNLTPDCHTRPPKWFKDEYRGFAFKHDGEGPDWNLPTSDYQGLLDSSSAENGEYKIHGHCLSWTNQSPQWMLQIIPENITSMQWLPSGLFFTGGNNSMGPYIKINKQISRRLFFYHILYVMRHFMSSDQKYGSSEKRGIIPFHSFTVVNEEIHESRHCSIIDDNPNEWKTSLKNLSWLMSLTDTDIDDIRTHYVYLLFKYAHIAVPNAQMAAKYKAGFSNPEIVDDYMKMDNHDDNGSIDAYITGKPPILIYNDFGINIASKAKVAYNMIREINFAWKTDPLYDGRNLIEGMGIQGHEIVNPITAKQNRQSAGLFARLIDEGLLDCICYTSVDIRQPYNAPGGEAHAPAVLNQTQADVIGYQYALLFKVFEKYKKYIDHVIFWSQYGASWMNSYVPFDHEKMASQAYYGIMDPDKFINEHSHIEYFFNSYK